MDRVTGSNPINIETDIERKRLRIQLKRVAGKWIIRRETENGVIYRVRRTV